MVSFNVTGEGSNWQSKIYTSLLFSLCKELGIKKGEATPKASTRLGYCVRLKLLESRGDLWISCCRTEELPRNWVTQSEMGAIIIVSNSENEASLQSFVQFLELKKKPRLFCESVNESFHVLLKWGMSLTLLKSFATAASYFETYLFQ